jgi:hypothetical protein
MSKNFDVQIIGGGLAGCEAAWQLAQRGVRVKLSEMRGTGEMSPAHQTDGLAELVCSNSFRSDDAENNAVGLLHQEMRDLGSLIMQAAEVAKVPAGSALAVDRDVFSETVTKHLENNDQQNHPSLPPNYPCRDTICSCDPDTESLRRVLLRYQQTYCPSLRMKLLLRALWKYPLKNVCRHQQCMEYLYFQVL